MLQYHNEKIYFHHTNYQHVHYASNLGHQVNQVLWSPSEFCNVIFMMSSLKLCISTIKFLIVSSTWLDSKCSYTSCVMHGAGAHSSSRSALSFCESIVVSCNRTILHHYKTFQTQLLWLEQCFYDSVELNVPKRW